VFVSFDSSIGDFLAMLELVGTVFDTLCESSRSNSSFRSLINELYALESALLLVKHLNLDDCYKRREGGGITLEGRRNCGRVISDSLGKIFGLASKQ